MIDTHETVKLLEGVGFETKAAETLSSLLRQTQLGAGSQFVTHETLRYELRLLEQRMVIKLGGIAALAVAVASGIVGIIVAVWR
jgi:hypothetical protein